MRPDLVLHDDARHVVAAIGSKDKAETPSGSPDADLYQLVAYCTAFGLPRGHLV